MPLRADATLEHTPHLSVVAVSRNDNHGVNILGRMQHFVDGFIAQCRRQGLEAELILGRVESTTGAAAAGASVEMA